MASKVEICNMALGHLGQGKQIANLDTENSSAAAACRTFFDVCIGACLRDFKWPIATKFRALALIEEDPNDEWNYSYQYPADCKNFIRIISGQRTDTNLTRVPFKIANSDTGKIIYTDKEDAQAEYTVSIDDPTIFDDDFVLAASYRLASYIAPQVAGADPRHLGDAAMKKYLFELATARANAAKEEQPDLEPDGEFVSSRD